MTADAPMAAGDDAGPLPTAPHLTVVVPAFNEQDRLPGTLTGLTAVLRALPLTAEVVVVDNASTDDTAGVVRAFAETAPVAVRLMECATQGKGAAVRAGVLGTDSTYVGFCDADLATDMDALVPALAFLGAGVNVVVGSRGLAESAVWARHSMVRKAGAWVFRAVVRGLVPGISDTQCGFKFFDRASAVALFRGLQTPGFAFDVELLARAQRAGMVIAELPVQWVDQPGSTFSTVRDGLRSFSTLAQLRGQFDRASGWGSPARSRTAVDPVLEVRESG